MRTLTVLRGVIKSPQKPRSVLHLAVNRNSGVRACGRWPVRFRMVRVTLLVPEAGPSSPTGRRTASCQPGRLCNRARANRSDISAYSGPPNLRPHTGVPAGVWLLRTSQRPLSEGSMRTAQRPLRKNIPNHPSTSEGQVSYPQEPRAAPCSRRARASYGMVSEPWSAPCAPADGCFRRACGCTRGSEDYCRRATQPAAQGCSGRVH